MPDGSPRQRPEWATDDDVAHHGDAAFTSHVMPGVGASGGSDKADTAEGPSVRPRKPPPRRRRWSVAELKEGIEAGDRTRLAQAITLVESNNPAHIQQAQELLTALPPPTDETVRVGITGVPGAGKSTFIEALGMQLIDAGHRVAVLAVDPSSSRTGGSILGDKTRMEKLAREEAAFIRPSPSGGALGGVTRKSRETLLLCEAAGFDIVLVETVGVGQSEVSVREMVDFFLLLQIAGGGDELQGIKKGVIELADAIVVNKADGDNRRRAEAARAEFKRILHYLQPSTEGWTTPALTCSSLEGEGIDTVWQAVEEYVALTRESGAFGRQRREQQRAWVHALLGEALRARFYAHPAVKKALPGKLDAVAAGEIPAYTAVQELLAEGDAALPDGDATES